MMFVSQLPAVKKDIIFGAIQIKLGPSYFVRALLKISKNVNGTSDIVL